MSLQTTYLNGGNWATRQVNLGEIMAGKPGTSGDADSKPTRRKSPYTGLLSRTLMPGPQIKIVLPARLRHREKADIVFVGETFIQIKELVPSGHLEDIVTKSDFDTKILDAKVIGSLDDAALEAPIMQGAGLGESFGKLFEDNWHGQILVLLLASRELLFLYGAEGESGRPEFIHVRRPLPQSVSSLEEYGRHIVIEPRSRFMAISASHRFFGIFALKDPSVIRSEMKEGPVNPIKEERFSKIEGDIVAMEFLYPAAGDEDTVVLMFLVNHQIKTHVACYTWKASEGLAKVEAKRMKSKLQPDCLLPLLFIPLTLPTSCLLVSKDSFYVYEVKLAEGIVSCRESLEDASGCPFTAWVRPRRNITHHEKEDDLYLCREDGELSYLSINKDRWQVVRNSRIESVGCNVDTGFAILDPGFRAGGDILVVAGSNGDGGLFLLGARRNSKCLQRIRNWASVCDAVVIKAQKSHIAGAYQDGQEEEDSSFDRVFTYSLTGSDQGSVTELRHGIEARAGLVIDQEDSSRVMDVWAIPNSQTGGTFFLFSYPLSSSVISLPVDSDDELYMMSEEDSGLDLETQTIAAGSSRDGVVMQVTGSSIHLSVFENMTLRYSTRCQGPTERILAAAVNGGLSLFAVAVKTNTDIRVHLRSVKITNGTLDCPTVGEPLPLACEPVNLTIERIFSQSFLFIGTTDGKLLTARIDSEQGLVPLLERIITLPPTDELKICESFTVITVHNRERMKTKLLCGLRSGYMISYNVQLDESSGNIDLVQTNVRKLGDTSVRIRRYESDTTFAIVTCGSGLWRLSHVEDEDSEEYALDKIWITDQNNPARMQSTIDVFTCVDSRPDLGSGGLGGSLVCIMKNQLLCCVLEKTPKTVPRHILLRGRPRRLIYSDYLKQLVVGLIVEETKQTSDCIERWRRPTLEFVDPDAETPIFTGPWRPVGLSGEEVTALLDWTVSSGEKVHHMIALATMQPHSKRSGRVVYFIARPNSQNPSQIDCKVKHVIEYDDPVRSVAAFKPDSLVLAVGQQIIFQTVDLASKRWRKRPGYRLESDAVSIRVQEPYIYAQTLKNSLCILKVTDTGLALHAQDGSDTEGRDLVNLPADSGITMTSNMGGAIVGLSQVGIDPEAKLLHKAFAADMPLTSLRLCRSTRPAGTGAPQVTYGAAIDGTMYRFTTLSEKQWRLLRFIQDVCMRDPHICPLAKRQKRHVVDAWEVTVTRPTSLHVNGDILGRLVERGIGHLRRLMGAGEVDEMVDEGADDGAGGEKLRRFLQYAGEIVPGAEDPFAAVMVWMGRMVRVSL
ncbi:hypothetical protein AJ79_01470 [Helicocarpus griseus UAMH5409]|uniref:Uncharacterized protein n=1 Tax=Helicocarpus griseus UAMH5409 TaxID=1447875 RepID=A0A2B7Y5R7_9EURO|nr:hypothetical protein AJ79_01470 [Helicocarpus griseus UAMH5409]